MYIIQHPLIPFEQFCKLDLSDRLVLVLEALDAEKLLETLERERLGRHGYTLRSLWYALIAGVVHRYPTIAELVRQLKRDANLRYICGIHSVKEVPSEHAFSRFLKALVKHEDLLEEMFLKLVREFQSLAKGFGEKVVVDSTDVHAYARARQDKQADPDARWGVKGSKEGKGRPNGSRGKAPEGQGQPEGGEKKEASAQEKYYWFGYKLHLLVDAHYELPIAYEVTSANESDTKHLSPLLAKAKETLSSGEKAWQPQVVIGDSGYDSTENCRTVIEDYGAAPIIPLNLRNQKEPGDICNLQGTPLCGGCAQPMIFWGRDGRYLKYRCPTAFGKSPRPTLFPCSTSKYGAVIKLPIHRDYRRYTPVPRETKKWKRLYKKRGAVERVNSRLKEMLILDELRVRGKAKVSVRMTLNLLVMMAAGVAMAKRKRWGDVRRLVRLAA